MLEAYGDFQPAFALPGHPAANPAFRCGIDLHLSEGANPRRPLTERLPPVEETGAGRRACAVGLSRTKFSTSPIGVTHRLSWELFVWVSPIA